MLNCCTSAVHQKKRKGEKTTMQMELNHFFPDMAPVYMQLAEAI